jgi:hypothetical protein
VRRRLRLRHDLGAAWQRRRECGCRGAADAGPRLRRLAVQTAPWLTDCPDATTAQQQGHHRNRTRANCAWPMWRASSTRLQTCTGHVGNSYRGYARTNACLPQTPVDGPLRVRDLAVTIPRVVGDVTSALLPAGNVGGLVPAEPKGERFPSTWAKAAHGRHTLGTRRRPLQIGKREAHRARRPTSRY